MLKGFVFSAHPSKSLLVASVIIPVFVFTGGKAAADSLIVTGPVTISSDTTFDSVRVASGGTLTANGQISVLGNMTIQSGGVVTHSFRLLAGLRLNVLGTLDVRAGGLIDLNSRGLLGGDNGSVFGPNGETFNNADAIVSGAAGGCGGNLSGAGGSYGGQGAGGSAGGSPAPYGLLEDPRHLGSGGGSSCGDRPAGNGGGRATITAGICIIDGTLRANGGAGVGFTNRPSGGGSGGAIRMNVGSLSGSGILQAVGGNGLLNCCAEPPSGSGGGGRIAIYFNNSTFPYSNISAQGGTEGNPGSPGTIVYAVPGTSPTNSFADNRLILSPAGNATFDVTLRDSSGNPIAGSHDAWLDFSGVSGLVLCAAQTSFPLVPATTPSDANGKIQFFIKAGGCTNDSVKVMTSQGLLAKVPIRSLDHNGGLVVTAPDYVGDTCNDYNNDGVTNIQDWIFFEKHLGESCVDCSGNYTTLTVFTVPGPDALFQGDTIQVCGRIDNTLNETATIDSVNFLAAGWGIARPWSKFAQVTGLSVGPRDTLTVCRNFVIPEVQHGCFQVYIYPRYGNGPVCPKVVQINRDALKRPRLSSGKVVSPVSGMLSF
ncbi:MAG: hypothetical protein ACM3YF_02630, partial [Candidatus Zixiibacteriota bacterium]